MNEDGSVVIGVNMDVSKAEKDLAKLKEKIERLRKDANEKKDKQGALETEFNAAKEEALKTTDAVQALKKELEQIRQITSVESAVGVGEPLKVIEALEREKEITAELPKQEALLKSQNKELERLAKKYADAADQVINVERNLETAEKDAVDLNAAITEAANGADDLEKNTKSATNAFAKFEKRVVGLVKRVFVFAVITAALRRLRDWLSRVVVGNEEVGEAVAKLKASLLTLVQPLVNIVIPAFLRFVQVLTAVINRIIDFVAAVTGKDKTVWAQQAKALNDEKDAIKGVGSAAKEASKYLAPFDELNTMGDTSSGGGAGGASSGGADFSDLLNGGGAGDFGNDIEEKLTKIGTVAGLAMLGLGLILAFSGANIPLGLSLMAAGAVALGIAAGGDSNALKQNITQALKDFIDVILAISFVLLVLGIILLFVPGQLMLGIGLIVVGAAGLAAEYALNGEETKAKIIKALKENAGAVLAVSFAFLVMGIILLFVPGMMPLGIGLIILGVAGLAGEAAVHWDTIKETLSHIFREDGAAILSIRIAVLVLGIILLFVPNMMLVGIGMIAAGAIGIYKSINPDWNAIGKQLVSVFQKNGKTIAAVSAALLVIGILLCFVPGALPLGVGLVLLGAGGMFTVTALNWNAILDKFREVWRNVSNWFKSNVAPKFTKQYWLEKFSTISEGLKTKAKDGINAAIELFNKFVDWVNKKLNITWDSIKIAGQEVVPSGSFQLIKLSHIPKLATGAVIPPNREFTAVLGDQRRGTNIEAPESLIRQIMREESGGANAEVVSLMRQMLEYLAAGQVIEMDGREFGRATARSVKTAMRTGAIVL